MTADTDSPTETKTIEFTVDGESFSTHERELTAAAILERVNKTYPDYYLVEVKGQRERETFKNPNDVVRLREGSKFVSVSTGPTPVS